MRKSMESRFLLLGCAAVILFACILPLNTPSVQETATQALESVDAIIANTASAARTQTATAAPSITPSSSPTLTVTSSPTVTSPTPTQTFLFLFFTETLIPLPSQTDNPPPDDAAGGAVATATRKPPTAEWACIVTGKSPPKGSTVAPGKDFYVAWTVLNSGTKTWTANGVDFVYDGGYRHAGGPIRDLPMNVSPGGTITLKVTLTAPKKPDIYNVIWTLKVGKRSFCHMKITFEVAKP